MPASGTGDIASFSAINNGNNPVTASITVTPVSAGIGYFANYYGNSISVINLANYALLATIPVGQGPNDVTPSPDGSRVYVANRLDGTVSVIDATSNTVIATIPIGTYNSVNAVTVSPDGSRAYVTFTDPGVGALGVDVINTSTNTLITTIATPAQPQGVVVTPDGGRLFVTDFGDNTVLLITASTNTIMKTIPVGNSPWGEALSPDGSLLYVVNSNFGGGVSGSVGTVSVINTSTGNVTATITVEGVPTAIAVSPDGSKLYVTNSYSGTVSVIDATTNTVTASIPVLSDPQGVTVSPDGSLVYVADGDVSVISTATNQVVATIQETNASNNWTATNGFGNFIGGGVICSGVPFTFTITVNPTPPVITASSATGAISACVGAASSGVNVLQFTVSGTNLTDNVIATAPAGFEISLTAGSGYANSVTLIQNDGSIGNTVMYVRSAASAPAGSLSGNVVLTSTGAITQNVTVTGTVNALPTVDPVNNQTINAGVTTTAVNFTGTGTAFTWVNDTPGIGLASEGTGNIASFTAINTTSSPITATITATPVPAEFAYITNNTDNTVSVINTTTNAVVATIAIPSIDQGALPANPFGVSASADGSRVYVTNQYGTVSVINTANNTVSATIAIPDSIANGEDLFATPWGIAASPVGNRLYVSNYNQQSLSFINTLTNTITATISLELNDFSYGGVAVSPDGGTVYVPEFNEGKVLVINTATYKVTNKIPVASGPRGVVMSPDGSKVYVATQNGVSVISTATNTTIANIVVSLDIGGLGITVSPDGNRVYLTNIVTNSVYVVNTVTNALLATIPVGKTPYGVSINAEGTLVYVVNSGDNTVSVINTATNTVTATINVGNSPYSFGNFISTASGCKGQPITFTITVNPTIPTITAGTATGMISACAGTASASPEIQQFIVSGSNLTDNITATAPTGFEISLAAGSGYANSVTISQIGGTLSNAIIYVRSAASAPVGSLAGNVTIASAGASSQNIPVTGTVFAPPVVNPVSNQTVNNGSNAAAINFTGTGSTFAWTNDTPGIGLTPTGTGDISSFQAVNTTGSPLTATITVTPLPDEFAYIPNNVDNSVSVINTNTNALVTTIPIPYTNPGNVPSAPFGVSAVTDGGRVYISNWYGTISVINTANNTLASTITMPTNVVNGITQSATPWGIAASPVGNHLYVVNCGQHSLDVINTLDNQETAAIDLGQNYSRGGVVVSPDDTRAYVTDFSSSNVYVINTVSNQLIYTIPVLLNPYGLTISADGSKVYVATAAGVSIINTATSSVAVNIPVGSNGGGEGITVSPDGNSLFLTNDLSNQVYVISTVTNTLTAVISVGAIPYGISVNSNGSRVFVSNSGDNTVSVINTANNAVIATVNVGNTPFSFGNFTSAASGCAGTPVTFTITVNPSIINPGPVTGIISTCLGSASASPDIQQFSVSGTSLVDNITAAAPVGFEISATANGSYAGSLVINQTNGVISSTVIYVRAAASAPGGNISGNVTLTSADALMQNVAVSGVVNTTLAPVVNIIASVNNVCIGTSVTFTAMVTTGGSAPAYQWLVNGSSAGTNSATFTTNMLNNGDLVSCTVTSNAACAVPVSATSNIITMSVAPQVAPSVTITTSANNVCAGTSITFTATPINGGAAPVYQWLLNGNNSGITGISYNSSTLVNGDVISCVMTGNAACSVPADATSNSITVVVNQPAAPTVSIAASSNNICAGTPVTFTAMPVNGGANPTYQWFLNGNTAGMNSSTYSSSTLVNGDVVSCQLISNATCLIINSAVSNSIAITVNPQVVPALSISASANSICAGTIVIFTAVAVNGGDSPVYQWLINGNNAGTNSSTFSSNSFADGDVISCVMTSSALCAVPVSITSNSITITVNALPVVDAGGSKTIKEGYSVTLNAAVTGNIASISWSPAIGLSNSAILNPVASPTSTTLYTLTVQTATGCIATDTLTVSVFLDITIPNTFTPNGDGINDTWNIKYLDSYPNCTVNIYNRYGERLYSSIGYGVPWDGKYGGVRLPTGTYYYIINLKSGLKVLSGSVTIIK